MLGKEPLDRLRAKEATATDRVGSAHLAHQRTERATEPVAERDPEALLGPREGLGRESVGKGALEDVLRLEAAELQAHRKLRRQFHDAPVEEWHADLEGTGHAGAVGLRQDSLTEVALEIEIEHALEALRRRRGRENLVERGVGRRQLHAPERVGREQLLLLGRRERAEPHGVALDVGVVHALEEPLELEVEAQVAERDRQALDGGLDEPPPHPARDQFDHPGEPMRLVRRVAGEELVATVARERHRHRAAREARKQERRDQRRVAERLVEEVRQALDEIACSAGVEDLLVVVGAERLRHATGVGGFVEGRVFEADREGLETTADVPSGEGRDRARVDPAGEKDAQRHVADQVLAHGEVENAAEPLDRFRGVDRAVGTEGDRPVRLHLEAPVGVRQPVSGGKLPDRSEDRRRRRNVLVGEVARQSGEVEGPIDRRVLDEGLELGGEDERARRGIPEREREHPLEVAQRGEPTLLVPVHDDLGVGARQEAVAACGELDGQLTVVVDLTVEDRPDAAVLAAHRLVTALEVDDLEPTHRQRGRAFEEESLVVGAPVHQPIVHPLQDSRIRRPVPAREDVTDDAAHVV